MVQLFLALAVAGALLAPDYSSSNGAGRMNDCLAFIACQYHGPRDSSAISESLRRQMIDAKIRAHVALHDGGAVIAARVTTLSSS